MPVFALKSNRVVTPDGVVKAVITIEDGKIIDVCDELFVETKNIIDVGDDVIMPGIVDPHVHINEPGRTEWEGFDTGTRAAIAGGVTSLVEMPLNASPVTTNVEAFDLKIKSIVNGQTEAVRPSTKIHCNCGFWGGVVPGNEKDIEPLIDKGVLGFKAFLTDSGIDEFPKASEEDLRKVMPIIAKYRLPLLVHCEIWDKIRRSPLSTRHYKEYLASRPKEWEDNAIASMIRLCEEFNCRTHIVHLSSSNSIAQIGDAKQKGLPLSVETCQHYLFFNAEEISDGRTDYKCAPPIRERENNIMLWEALKFGIIDFVATDHSPAPPAMKELESGDFMKAWGGISSIQFSLSALWTAGRKHGCSLIEMTKWLCQHPTALPRLNKKGKIAKGYDADLVIWDPEAKFTVTKDIIHHRHKITPYLGKELYGVIKQTWLAGEKVYENTSLDGSGKFLHLNKGRIIYHE